MQVEVENHSSRVDPSVYFPSTYWPSIQSAANPKSKAGYAALSETLAKYLRPMELFVATRFSSFLRREKVDAGDLIQEFIACRILDGPFFRAAKQTQRSLFRNYLKASLSNFVLEKIRRSNAIKRAALNSAVSMDSAPVEIESSEAKQPSPSLAMDREWARILFQNCVDRMRLHCEDRNQSNYWHLFELRFLKPYLEGTEPVSYNQLAAHLGFRSHKAAADAMREARAVWRTIVRNEIGEYTVESKEIEEEIRLLIMALSS